MGFKRKGKIFHRLVNEKIVQMLSYTKFSDSFTIQFCICPLCAGYENTTFMDDERLGILLGNEAYAEWEFDGSDCARQTRESLEICKKYLFSLFESVCGYENFFNYAIESHIKAFGNRNSIPYDYGFYNVCLKLGRYDMVKRLQNEDLEQIEQAVKQNRGYGIEPTPERLELLEKRSNGYRQMREATNKNDRDYIENYLKEKELYSLESYLKNFCKKKA